MAAPFLAAPLLLKGGLLTGGTAAVAAPFLAPDLFGQTVKQQLGGEEFDRTAEKGQKVDRTQPLEKLFDWIYGRSQEDFEKAGQKRSDRLINKTIGAEGILSSTNLLAQQYGLSDSFTPKLGANQSIDEYKNKINEYAYLAGLAKDLQDNHGESTAGISTPQELQDLYRVTKKKAREKPEKDQQKYLQMLFGDRGKAREHQLELTGLQHNQAMEILANKNLQSDKVRADQQALAILNANNNRAAAQDRFQLGQMQMQMQGRRLDMEQANANHTRNLQTIATLMQGLQGVANASNRVRPPRSYYTL